MVEHTLCDMPMRFQTTWGLFSPREIDDGSRMLLRYLKVHEDDDCLDLGCGYGPLGITIAKLAPKGKTVMVDKDYVAIEYAGKNIKLNGADNCEAMLSNGFSSVGEQKFSLVVSNIPAKVGKELLYIFLYDALAHMQPGARIYVVTINGLRQFIKKAFRDVFGNYDKLKQGAHYTVAMAIKEVDKL